MQKRATISACGRYRWNLSRFWSEGRKATFVLLNPSTADAKIDDPTLRRCIKFAQREQCGELTVVNLFGLRATDPKELLTASDPVGKENDAHVCQALKQADLIICGWGANPLAKKRADKFLASNSNAELWCLGKSQSGAPKHPLYLKSEAPLIKFP